MPTHALDASHLAYQQWAAEPLQQGWPADWPHLGSGSAAKRKAATLGGGMEERLDCKRNVPLPLLHAMR